MWYLETATHRGNEKLILKPCGVSVDILGNECKLRRRGGCHGLDGSSGYGPSDLSHDKVGIRALRSWSLSLGEDATLRDKPPLRRL
ncbi:Uncharacterized protein TCM_009969 [Theobroma cacao]|uniref:Uncharacterized protein n=1 Tax=Theobroma cacao TaxID=3641 RepID=A0A061E7A0_THECC|nr:Uncharacterized protein TCM_009969 [Theobroma cacao]